jgi:hypothetical protein
MITAVALSDFIAATCPSNSPRSLRGLERSDTPTACAGRSVAWSLFRPSGHALYPQIVDGRLRIAELSGEVDVLARQVPYHIAESSDVTARMREALDKSYAKRLPTLMNIIGIVEV